MNGKDKHLEIECRFCETVPVEHIVDGVDHVPCIHACNVDVWADGGLGGGIEYIVECARRCLLRRRRQVGTLVRESVVSRRYTAVRSID